MKKNLILLLTAFIFISCIQKSNKTELSSEKITLDSINKTLTLKEYQHDFKEMVEILLKTHPQPYAFTSKDSFQKLIDNQFGQITDSTTIGGFYWLCSPVVASINCGHTFIQLPKQFYDISNSVLFPLDAQYINSKLFVLDAKNNSDKLSSGTEILAINGVDVAVLRKEIFQHLSSDGFNESLKQEKINYRFAFLCSIYFGFPSSYFVTINQNGYLKEIKLNESVNSKRQKSFLNNCENQLCFELNKKKNIAIITIRSFSYYNHYEFKKFKSFIDSCFHTIKENKTQNLIIDVRNNFGGDPFCGSYLIEHIAQKPYTYFHENSSGYIDLKGTIQPNSNRFKNKPYILINGLCTSTTGHFCSIVKENDFGIFVGNETGATYTCNDNSTNFTLKYTKLFLRVARETYYTSATTLTSKNGITPDYYVIEGIDNILNNTDTVLKYTLKLIDEK